MTQRTIPLAQKIFSHTLSVALVANGAMHDYPFMAALIRQYDKCVAVDGGLLHCHEMHILPHLIIGDFDSIPAELLTGYRHIPCEKFPVDKNESDMELAIHAVNSPSMQKIGLFGALEKRTDHALSNLHLMCRLPGKIVIETENERLFAINSSLEIPCHPGQRVSIIPLTKASGVCTQGLKWELHDAVFDKYFMSLSNICLTSAFKISVADGDLICCLSRD